MIASLPVMEFNQVEMSPSYLDQVNKYYLQIIWYDTAYEQHSEKCSRLEKLSHV